jgi:hypothetical protein
VSVHGRHAARYLVVTNRTPIATSLTAWLETFGAEKASHHHHHHHGGIAHSDSMVSRSIAPSDFGDVLAAGGGLLPGGNQAKGGREGVSGRRGMGFGGGAASTVAAAAGTVVGGTMVGGNGGFGVGTAAATAARDAPIKLSSSAERHAPYRSADGRAMMASRRLQQGSAKALGNKVGRAPQSSEGGAWCPAWWQFAACWACCVAGHM